MNVNASRILMHHLPFAWCCWYVNEDDVIISSTFRKLLGIENSHVFNLQDIFRLFGQSSLSQFQRALQHLYTYGGEFSLQVTLEHAVEREFIVNGSLIAFEQYQHIFRKQMVPNKKLVILSVQDATTTISDLRRQQRQFLEFEHELEMLRLYIAHIPLILWHKDSQGRLYHCNKAYAEALDTSPSRVVAENIELFPKRLLNNKQQNRIHAVIKGRRCLLEVNEISMGTQGILGYARDVTEIEQWEDTLQRYTQSQREILENLSNPIAIYDSDTRLQYFNSAYLKIFQFKESFLYGRPTYVEVLEDLRKRRKIPEVADFKKHKEERLALFNTIFEPVHEILHQPDGSFLKMTVCPHALGGVLFLFEDISDKLALERGYNTLLAVQKETIDNLHEGLAVVGSDLRLRLSNNALGKLLYLDDKLRKPGTHIADILQVIRSSLTEENFNYWQQHLYELCEKRHTSIEEVDILPKGKIQISYIPLPDGSHLFSFVDIYDRWQFEQSIQERNEALEQSDRLKTDFISHVSYELRSPLNTITGFIDILKNEYFGSLNERQMDYCQGISDASHKLMQLISDIIDLASIEAGKLNLNYTEIEVDKFLESCAALIRNRSYDQGIDLSVINNANATHFYADEKRLKHVMFNLLTNALKFTLPGGQVTITAFNVEDATDMLGLCVSDTGVGISGEDQKKIFDMFEHGSSLHTFKKGAGLGLSLVKRLTELHQGQVFIVSKHNEGTKIICHIPLKKPELI